MGYPRGSDPRYNGESHGLERLLMQSIRQSPLNLRPLMGVKPKRIGEQGRGYMASGLPFSSQGNKRPLQPYLRKAEDCLEWLDSPQGTKI